MPNGRSGGFVIQKADLKQLVQAVSKDAVVGRLMTELEPRPQSAPAVEVARHINEYPHHRVAVEEQDHNSYIIHLSNEPIIWVLVNSESPIFGDLRRRHKQWMAENPGWHGWTGF